MTSSSASRSTPLAVVLALALGRRARRRRASWRCATASFFKLGVRNITRRRGRTALIVVGLMLGTTIIAAALATGDTMSHTIRSSAIESLGQTDELVSAKGTEVERRTSSARRPASSTSTRTSSPRSRTSSPDRAWSTASRRRSSSRSPCRRRTQRQTEPRVTLFAGRPGPHGAASATIRTARRRSGHARRSAAAARSTSNEDAADELASRAGDRSRVFAGGAGAAASRPGVVDYDGAGTTARRCSCRSPPRRRCSDGPARCGTC